MGFLIIFLSLFLLQSVFGTSDDIFDGFDLINSEDDTEMEPYMDRKARNDKFLRFGRRFWEYETPNDNTYDDSEIQRPLRTGSLNVNTQQRPIRDKSSFLRFGRSISEDNKKRGKRGAPSSTSDSSKRHDSYLRFGRNSNFMRFGRTPDRASLPGHSMEEALLKQIIESRNEHLINYLNNLLKQSKDNLGHGNEI